MIFLEFKRVPVLIPDLFRDFLDGCYCVNQNMHFLGFVLVRFGVCLPAAFIYLT